MENSYCNKKGNIERQVMTTDEPKLTHKQTMGEKIGVTTNITVTILPTIS